MNILSVLMIIVLKKTSGPKMEEQEGNGANCIKRSIATCTFTKHDSSHLVKEGEMGGTYGTRQGERNICTTILKCRRLS